MTKVTYQKSCRITPNCDLNSLKMIFEELIKCQERVGLTEEKVELKMFKEEEDTIFSIAQRGEKVERI